MSIKQRLYPTPAQAEPMAEHCAMARFVWNLALEQRMMWRRDKTVSGIPAPSFASQARELTAARAADAWLGSGSTVVQQGALRDLDRAFANFFSRPDHFGYPTWRKKDLHEGFVVRDLTLTRLNRGWATVAIPKVGPVRFRLSRPWVAVQAATSARVTFRNGRWHLALVTAPADTIVADTGAAVGIDRGVANSIATSDGVFEHAPSLTEGEQRRFLALQRRLSRQQPGSRRREATLASLKRLHARLGDRRTDWVEQTSTYLARTYDLVVVEKLPISNMTARPKPKPDPDNPGTWLPNGARAKARLNAAILASCWGSLAQRLNDKLPEGHLIEVDPRNTSRTCHECGHIDAGNRESQAVFTCTRCGHQAHADTNAAHNILGRATTPIPTHNPRTSGARTHQPARSRVNQTHPQGRAA